MDIIIKMHIKEVKNKLTKTAFTMKYIIWQVFFRFDSNSLFTQDQVFNVQHTVSTYKWKQKTVKDYMYIRSN